MTDEFEFYDAAYLLGSLDEDDRRAFERHLAGCVACSARVDELRPTIGALRAVRDGDAAADEVPDLLPSLLHRAAGERRRRRFVVAASGLLAAAAVVALLVVVLVGGRSSNKPPSASGTLRPVASSTSPIQATATLVDRRWGTSIDLRCRYEEGFVPGVPYDLVVIDTAKGRHPAGSWRLVPGTVTSFTGGVDLPRSKIASVQVTLPDGQPILELDL